MMEKKALNLCREKAIQYYKDRVIHDLKKAGINPDPYGLAIIITAETLFERRVAYDEYLERGGRNTTERGGSEASAVRLAVWNSQARACLSMLKLTPCRGSLPDEELLQGGDQV